MKRKNIFKRVAAMTASMAMLSTASCLSTIIEAGAYTTPDGSSYHVPITDKTFPDEIFRSYISENFDREHDGMLSRNELMNIRDLRIYGMGISDLGGIEYMRWLENLYCERNELTELDLTCNEKLINVNCDRNHLTSLVLPQSETLREVSCHENNVPFVDASMCPNLRLLDIAHNEYQYKRKCGDPSRAIDLSEIPGFTEQMSAMTDWSDPVEDNIVIPRYYYVTYEQIYTVSNYERREHFEINNDEESVYRYHDDLEEGICPDCGYLFIDEKNFPDELFREKYIRFLDTNNDGWLSPNERYNCTDLNLDDYRITSLDGLQYFTNLRNLNIEGCMIDTLDLSKNRKLTSLSMSDSIIDDIYTPIPMNELDVSGHPYLEKLICEDLDKINIDGCPITEIEIRNYNAPYIDLSTLSNDDIVDAYIGLGFGVPAPCTGDRGCEYDLSQVEGMDVSRIKSVSGGSLSGSILYIEPKEYFGPYCDYYYDCGNCMPLRVHVSSAPVLHNTVDGICADCGAIEISEYNFPDEVFRNYINEHFGYAGFIRPEPGYPSRKLDLSNMDIHSLQGLQFFRNIYLLDVSNTPLTSIDFSGVPYIGELNTSNTAIRTLDLSNTWGLQKIDASNSDLEELLLPGRYDPEDTDTRYLNTEELLLSNTNLTELSLPYSTCLDILDLRNTPIRKLDISRSSIDVVHAENCKLRDLKINSIIELYLDNNELTELDLFACPSLEILSAKNNKLETVTFPDGTWYADCNLAGNNLLCIGSDDGTYGELTIDLSDNKRTITADKETWEIDIADIAGFDTSKVSDLKGAQIKDNKFVNITGKKITYNYDTNIFVYNGNYSEDCYDPIIQNFTINVIRPVRITKQPVNILTMDPGEKVTASVDAVGDGLKYAWYIKGKSESSFKKSSSDKNYSFALTQDLNGAQLYCIVSDENGLTEKSDTISLKVAVRAKINTQPKDATAVNAGDTVKAELNAVGDGITYTWYFKNPGDTKFYKSSVNTNVYSVPLTADKDGRQVYCIVEDEYGNKVQSNTVTLRIAVPVKITSQPKDILSFKDGELVKTSVKAVGDGLKYEWYFKDPSSKTFSKSSLTSDTYALNLTAAKSGRQVYCIVTDKYGFTAKSDTVTLKSGNAAKITSQPKDVTVSKAGDTAKVSVGASGDGITYTWYFKNPGGTQFYKSSVNTNVYSVPLTADKAGRQIYCVIEDIYGNKVQSDTVTLRLISTAKITAQPKSVTVSKPGDTASITIGAEGDGLTYTWYIKDPGYKDFAKSSIKTNTYAVALTEAKNCRQVYCVITDKYGNTVKSETASMKIAFQITAQPVSASVSKAGDTVQASVKAVGEDLTYTWYFKNPGDTKFYKSGVTSNTYSVALTADKSGRQVYCVVTDKSGKTITTNTVTLSIAFQITSQPKDVTVSKAGDTAKAVVGAVGNELTYTWYFKNPGDTKFYKSGVTSNTYSVALSADKSGRQVYCVVTDKSGKTITTNTVTLSIAFQITSQPKDVTVSKAGDTAKAVVGAVGNELTYTWYFKNPGDTKFYKSGVTSNTYSVALTADKSGRQVYCVVTDKSGKTLTTNTITLSIAK